MNIIPYEELRKRLDQKELERIIMENGGKLPPDLQAVFDNFEEISLNIKDAMKDLDAAIKKAKKRE